MKKQVKHSWYLPLEEVLSPVLPKPPYNGNNWQVNFQDLRGDVEGIGKNYGVSVFDLKTKKTRQSKVVVIKASNNKQAEEAATLIHSCLCIIDGNRFFVPELDDLLPLSYVFDSKSKYFLNNEKEFPFTLSSPKYFSGANKVQLACYMAAKASKDFSLVLAIHRLRSSYEFSSIPHIELDPHHSENLVVPTLRRSSNSLQQVYFANAILISFGAIEEIGTNPVAKDPEDPTNPNNKNKYSRDPKTGLWGVESKQYLSKQLEKNGIDPNKKFVWIARWKPRYLEKRRKTKAIKKMNWSKGHYVRDQEVNLLDALADASFLRNQVAAHKYSSSKTVKLIKTLSIYETVNVQNLARIVILEKMKMIELIQVKR